MSLFRRNGTSLIFVLLRVYQEELEPLIKMIIENGGAVSRSDNNMGIIFTQACNYSKLIWPDKNQNLIYDIRFIKKCVRKGKIVDPAPYKLSSMSYFDCAIMHFLYGGCKCSSSGTISSAVSSPTASNRQAVFQTQSQTSSVTEDVFYTPNEDMSESIAAIANPTGNTQDPLGSPPGLERSVKRERRSSSDQTSPDYTATVNIKINLSMPDQNSDASSGSTITGSSTIVSQRGGTDRPMQLSSGDDRPTEALNETEKRPCSIEYHTQVEPKLQVALGLASKKRQQRTPTTLTDAHDAPNVVSTPEDNLSNVDDVTRSAPSGENGGTNLSDIADDTSVSYVVKSIPNSSPASPARSDASTIVIKPQSSSQSSRKRSHSEAAVTETPPESNWIVPDDTWMHSDINQPVSKYIRCDDGERRLLKESQQSSPQRSEKPSSCSTPNNASSPAKTNSSLVINQYCKNYKQALKFSTQTKPGSTPDAEISKHFDKTKGNCTTSSSGLSGDDDILIAKVPTARGKAPVPSSDSENEISRSETAFDDESVNMPGPSGISKHPRVRNNASTSDSSSDEQDDDLVAKKSNTTQELIRFQNTCNKKKLANCKSSPRLKVRNPSDLETWVSIDDADSEARKTRKKTKADKLINKKKKSSEKYNRSARNGKTRSPSIETIELVDSDSSNDENTNSRATKIVRMKKPIKQSKHATKTWSRERDTCISSDNDSDPPLSSHELHGADVHSESRVTRATTKNRDTRISSDNDSDTSSSSHALHCADVYTKLEVARAKSAASSGSRERETGYRTWYTDSERRQMIQYIVDKEAFSLCSDMSFFESMASKKTFRHRSATSLYGEFRKILKKIDEYATVFKLTASTVRQFKKIK